MPLPQRKIDASQVRTDPVPHPRPGGLPNGRAPSLGSVSPETDGKAQGVGRARGGDRSRDDAAPWNGAGEAGRVADPAAENAVLRAEIENLRAALVMRSVIDNAVGMIMLAHCCDAEQALDRLKALSQNTNVKLRDIAGVMGRIVAEGECDLLDPDLYDIGLRALLRPSETEEA